jgi:hypothetical protein
LPSLSACHCPALHVACCPRPPLFSCRRPRRRCRRAPLLLNQSSSPDAVITISPLVPPSFVDCCFKRRAKLLLPTMVPSLSSGLPSLVGCFRCPPPPTLAASHGRRHTSSPVRYPHSRRFNVTVVVTGSSRRRCDAAGDGTTRDRRRRRRRRRRWGRRRRSFARHPRPRCAGDSPPLTAVESVDCTHRATISPPSSRRRRTRPDARSASLGRGALAAGAAWGLRALSLREEEEEGGAWRRLGAAGGGWGRLEARGEGSGGGGGGVSLV